MVSRYTTEAVKKTIISLMELLPRRNYTLTDEQVRHIMNRLNNRPRKSLGYLTPNEVFYERKRLTG